MNDKTYLAGGPAYFYPGAGDALPPGGAKVLLLTEGGVCIIGQWPAGHHHMVGWAPLPKRDRAKEALLK